MLSQLNPEVTFSQCDYGNPAGGPECTVLIYAGQQIRVPAPTPTPTLSPTLSGSETATPTLTATFNAPSALSPADRALFMKNEFITLRWVASGTLSEGQTYRVRVEDMTAGKVYSADTTDLVFHSPRQIGRDRMVSAMIIAGVSVSFAWLIPITLISPPNRVFLRGKGANVCLIKRSSCFS